VGGLSPELESSPSSERGERTPPAVDAPALSPAAAGVVSGTLLFFDDLTFSEVPVPSGGVQLYSATFPFDLAANATTNSSGQFILSGIPAGTYRIAFYSLHPTVLRREWYNAERFEANSDVVTLFEGVARNFGSIVLAPRVVGQTRVSGSDRFSTATALSQSEFVDASAPDVYIVNGFGFPDALSAGALAAQGGVLLMVETNRVPAVVQAELARLDPSSITIVGGTGVVSAAVQTQLEGFVASPSLVTRIAGTDRYDTSRQVITEPNGFARGADVLLVATGSDFPDALSAVPAAAVSDGALLLVNGAALSLDAATRTLIDSLEVPVFIIGGTGVVSSAIEAEIRTLVPFVSRFSGNDRFETAIDVARGFFLAADHAYLANAFNFPDALAAGPIAGQRRSPIYLIPRECRPPSVFQEIARVLANQVNVVGGTAVVSDNVLFGPGCPS